METLELEFEFDAFMDEAMAEFKATYPDYKDILAKKIPMPDDNPSITKKISSSKYFGGIDAYIFLSEVYQTGEVQLCMQIEYESNFRCRKHLEHFVIDDDARKVMMIDIDMM